jgi:HSP20 family molecular chaperone IbpA
MENKATSANLVEIEVDHLEVIRRTFKFPGRVNQDAVKASLKNGVLSVTVPKAPAVVAKKIAIQ